MRLHKIPATFLNNQSLCLLQTATTRQLSLDIARQQQIVTPYSEKGDLPRTDEEWIHAKEFDELPGPSTMGMIRKFLPGGQFYNVDLIEWHRIMRKEYGDIFRVKGILGRADVVFTFNPKDIETTYRNEGIWPIRIGLESFTYYRKEKRADIFQGIGGLVSEQGKAWADIRTKVNPILMKVQNVRRNLPAVNNIANEFIANFDQSIDPHTNQTTTDFHEEIKKYSFESISFIALHTRIGLLTANPDPNARRLAENMTTFFQLSYEYDVQPSIWKYFETPGFKKLIKAYDSITEITTNYIDTAIKKFEAEGNAEAKSILEKLCRIDRQVAIVMAIDMLMAGIDTTTAAIITILYHLARNPEKQKTLRQELTGILDNPTTPLTEENTKQMPYLRACIKEGLRIMPITPGNFRMAGKDLILSGYKVPKGIGVVMGIMELANEESYFAKSSEFLPERWLKTETGTCSLKSSNPFVYLPFGFGPRTCIGKRIAEMEIEVLLAKLISKYKITWQSGEDLKYISNIILVPHGNINFGFQRL